MATVPLIDNKVVQFVKFAIFQKKGNTKRTRKNYLSSEKMLGIAFLVSLIVHLVAIYTIPAVDLFSEGLGGDASGEIIEVDFIAEELPDESAEALDLGPEENQFAAAQPMPVSTPPPPDNVEPVEELEIPTPPDVDRPPEDFTLLAQTLDIEPEFSIERKRPTPEPTVPISRPPDVAKLEKLPVNPVRLDMQEQTATPVQQKSPVEPNQPEQEKPVADDRLQFPSGMPTLTVSSADTLPEKAVDQAPGFSGKRVIMPLAQDTPASGVHRDVAGQNSKRRLVGLDKGSTQDENRFGIFAGEKFELPQMKDSVQEAAMTHEEPNSRITGEIEQAKPLEVNTQIEGPLKGRAIVYKPALPQLTDIENEVGLRLKFWVLPDGTIGEVIPVKRGDAQLERVAIAYLKQWQFEPLASDVPQQNIWGTIPIVFTSR